MLQLSYTAQKQHKQSIMVGINVLQIYMDRVMHKPLLLQNEIYTKFS